MQRYEAELKEFMRREQEAMIRAHAKRLMFNIGAI